MDIQRRNEDLRTAVKEGNFAGTAAALEMGANVNSCYRDFEFSPLYLAVQRGDLEMVKLLLSKGAKVDGVGNARTPLAFACSRGRVEIVGVLLDHGASLEECPFGYIPLMAAVRKGHAEVVSVLLKRNADVNFKDNSGRTALMMAARHGHASIIRLLFSSPSGNTINVNETNCNDETALILAASLPSTECAALLVEHGADLESKDQMGWTPLIWATSSGQVDIVNTLLDLGASINHRDNHGRTALMWAAQRYIFFPLLVLCERGADLNVRDVNGCTAILAAASGLCQSRTLSILLRFGADLADTASPKTTSSTLPPNQATYVTWSGYSPPCTVSCRHLLVPKTRPERRL